MVPLLGQRTHQRSLQLFQLLILQHQLTFKVQLKQANQPSHLVILQSQWIMMYLQPLLMAQQLR